MPCTVDVKCHGCGEQRNPDQVGALWESIKDLEENFLSLRKHHLETEAHDEEFEAKYRDEATRHALTKKNLRLETERAGDLRRKLEAGVLLEVENALAQATPAQLSEELARQIARGAQ